MDSEKLLTAREKEVAALIVAGKSNRAIAQELWLSARTVENHVRSIFDKLGVRTRVEVATMLLRRDGASAGAPASTNLNAELTPLIGRDEVFSEVEALLAERRLVTLTGSGGVGKTRLAEALARSVLQTDAGDVWFVELATVGEPRFVAGAVAAAMRLGVTDAAPLDAIVAYLRERTALVVLDNCEQILDGAAALADMLLRTCPSVRVLATSAEPLAVTGEATYRVPSLDVPPRETQLTPEDALRYGAVALFVERARASGNSFRLTEENLEPVITICRRLDGIPLAIELAAARVSMLSPRQLSERLDERFRLLTGGKRTELARHRTLRGMIDWSHDLLSESEKTVFRRLSVFHGDWTLEDALNVCGFGELSGEHVFDGVFSLAQKSLLAGSDDSGERFRFLESTQAYAAEKLLESGEADETLARFVERMVRFAERARDMMRSAPEAEWLRMVEPQLDNVRGALEGTLGSARDVVSGASIAVALGPFWMVRRSQEGGHWMRLAQEHLDDLPRSLAANVLAVSVRLDPFGPRTLELAEMSIEAYRSAGDNAGLIVGLQFLGQTLVNCGLHEAARRPLEECVALTIRKGQPAIGAEMLLAVAEVYGGGDQAGAHERLLKAERAARASGRKRDIALALLGRTEFALARREALAAAAFSLEGIEAAEEIGDSTLAPILRTLRAQALLEADDVAAGREEICAALDAMAGTHGLSLAFTQSTVVAAALLTEVRSFEAAALLIGFAANRLERGIYTLLPHQQRLFDRALRQLQAERPDWDQYVTRGAGMDDRQIAMQASQGFAPKPPNAPSVRT